MRTCDAPAVTQTIVVGYDGKPPAQRALERALGDAKAAGARLLVVAVAEMPFDPIDPPAYDVGPIVEDPAYTQPPAQPPLLEPITREAMRQAEAAGVPADYVWEAGGDPARTIVDVARDSGATEIVVGSHHHGLLAGLFGGDVAAAVKREANCDVIVVA